jgi:acetyl esterase/lipase
VVWGESAGAHLAALLGLTAERVAGVVDWYGPADLLTMQAQGRQDAVAQPDAPDSRESLLLGGPVQQVPDLARAASPVTHVHPGAPAFHIAHGDADRFVPTAQSRALAAALREAGVHVELTVVPGADHLWMHARDPEEIFAAALDFTHRVGS